MVSLTGQLKIRRGGQFALFSGLGFLLVSCGQEEATVAPEPEEVEPVTIDEAGMAAGEEVEPIEASNAPAYVGIWSADPAWCQTPPGTADPAPIAITEGEMIGLENVCRIGFIDETGPNNWSIEAICEGEGVEYTEVRNLTVSGDTLAMSIEDATPTSFVRCL
ncbi:MAG: hypothetical protein AAFR21_14400 [Pseudomonadota bacterium]